MYPYKVSVVTPVYNVAPFLREAVDSIIAQDLGFSNIQLILVDDGSTDGSGQICDEYAAQYPDNILVIHKENGGVSSARNAGLDLVQGKYVNFMDADDKLGSSALSLCCHFLDTHYGETDVVTIPIHYFDARTGEHGLNFKFSRGTRVIDLMQEWQAPQYAVHCTVVKADCAKNLRFDERLSVGEDVKYMQHLLLHMRTLGVVREAVYHYRVRSSAEKSAIQQCNSSKNRYIPVMRHIYLDILTHCRDTLGAIPKFIQYSVMSDLRWLILQETLPTDVLTEPELREYLSLFPAVLQHIDDDVISATIGFRREHRIFTYRLKYGDALELEVQENNVVLCANKTPIHKASASPCMLEFYSNDANTCILEGSLRVYPGILGDQTLIVKSGKTEYAACSYGTRKPVVCMGQEVMHYMTFRFELPLKESRHYHWRFYSENDGRRIPLKTVWFGSFFPINSKYRKMYYARNGWILSDAGRGIFIRPQTPLGVLRHEAALCKELWLTRDSHSRQAVFLRTLVRILRLLKRKKLWLICDRNTKAGDNAEAFFRYVRENHPEINARFVINADVPDYRRMKQLGPVVKRGGFLHRLYALIADCVLSSHAEKDTFCPFAEDRPLYQDLLPEVNHIFLQHGITQGDCSDWLKRPNKNFRGILCAAHPECETFLAGCYEYSDRNIWLTGFPRFDRLYHAEENWITVMPTWRKYLVGSADKKSLLYSTIAGMEQSAFFRFYVDLLSHPRLHEAAHQYGYKLKFLPHPNMQPYLELFQNDAVDCLGTDTEYREVFAKSNLVVTDYSSAVFDFAYLRKPVVYTQFDAQDFFAGSHLYSSGYFDYLRMGFGEVETELESAVDRIIEYMENGCKLKDFYRERIDSFFTFHDQNNCQRLYEKMAEHGFCFPKTHFSGGV